MFVILITFSQEKNAFIIVTFIYFILLTNASFFLIYCYYEADVDNNERMFNSGLFNKELDARHSSAKWHIFHQTKEFLSTAGNRSTEYAKRALNV